LREELLGIAEIAAEAGVSRQAVVNWRVRDDGFPTPVAELSSGPVFTRTQVRQYLHHRRRGGPMAEVISFINLKGGVGKTTTCVAVGEMLAGEFRKKVLVIDLDPQTNATTMLMGEEAWLARDEKGHTLAALFSDALKDDPDEREFDLDEALVANASPVREVRKLDLLPSSLRLIDVQDRLFSIPRGQYYSANPVELLQRATKRIIDDYDYVLIDCPPNLGIITLNGLRFSQGFVIPTIPDVLSTYGIPQILKRVEGFGDELQTSIEPYGIVISKFRAASTVHNATVRRLRDDDRVHVFDTIVREANDISASAEHVQVQTLRQRYGYQGAFKAYRDLTTEIMEAAG
jgi:chromosome partitioning protein